MHSTRCFCCLIDGLMHAKTFCFDSADFEDFVFGFSFISSLTVSFGLNLGYFVALLKAMSRP